MTSESNKDTPPANVCIGIFAWNEERAIVATLESLLEQSLFANLAARGQRAEVVCVLNGCNDQTAPVARQTLDHLHRRHPARDSFTWRIAELPERGKVNAWNQFVHSISDRRAEVLFMMDADILIHRRDTLWNMFNVLEKDREANVAVDRPCKDVAGKSRKSWRDHMALASSQITLAAEAQLCAQLYAIRAATARNIYLPKELAACEDGFIKALVCTDCLAHEVWAQRLRVADGAEHIFEAYTSPAAILRNQKRQMIGQTMVHILIDKYLKALPESKRRNLAETIQRKEASEPGWLKSLIAEHLRGRHFWALYPGLLGTRFSQLQKLHGVKKWVCYPAAIASFGAALVSSWLAHRSLKRGCTDYWPKPKRIGFGPAGAETATKLTTENAKNAKGEAPSMAARETATKLPRTGSSTIMRTTTRTSTRLRFASARQARTRTGTTKSARPATVRTDGGPNQV